MNKVAVSVGDAPEEILRRASFGQQPIVKFDNNDRELIDPVRVGGKQVIFSALDVDLGDERNKTFRDL